MCCCWSEPFCQRGRRKCPWIWLWTRLQFTIFWRHWYCSRQNNIRQSDIRLVNLILLNRRFALNNIGLHHKFPILGHYRPTPSEPINFDLDIQAIWKWCNMCIWLLALSPTFPTIKIKLPKKKNENGWCCRTGSMTKIKLKKKEKEWQK